MRQILTISPNINQPLKTKGERGPEPTTGLIGVMLALHMCESVDIIGFGDKEIERVSQLGHRKSGIPNKFYWCVFTATQKLIFRY